MRARRRGAEGLAYLWLLEKVGSSYHTARSDCRVMSLRPARRPAIEISSSRSSQCSPTRLISTRARASELACKRRGNHASGTPKVRPSVKSTHIVCSSKRTAVAEMVIPCLQDQGSSFRDNAQDTRKFCRIKAIALRKRDFRLEPYFSIFATALHVDMPRLARKP